MEAAAEDPFVVVAMFLEAEGISVRERESLVATIYHYIIDDFFTDCILPLNAYIISTKTLKPLLAHYFNVPLLSKAGLGRLSGLWYDDAQSKKRSAWSGIERSPQLDE